MSPGMAVFGLMLLTVIAVALYGGVRLAAHE